MQIAIINLEINHLVIYNLIVQSWYNCKENTIVTAKVKSRIVQVTLGDGTYGSDNTGKIH